MKPSPSNNNQPIPILFTHYGDEWIRGSERCLLDLLQFINQDKFTPIVWCNSQVMYKAVSEMGFKTYQSDFPLLLGWKNPKFALKAYFKLITFGIQLVQKHQIKLLHANSAAPCQFLNIVARYCTIPLLAQLHSEYPVRDRITLGLHHASHIVGVSQAVVKPLLIDGIFPKKISVIANGINTDKFKQAQPVSIRKLLNIDNNDFVLITVGSLIHRKGFDLLINAVYRLVRQALPIQLVIIGMGPEYHSLQALINKLHLQKNIHLLAERNDVAGLLKGGADLFVSAARDEAFGLVFAEASLAGLAIVAPNIGGIPSIVISNKTGILYQPETQGALDSAIKTCYQSPKHRYQMAQAGKQYVLDHFNIQQNVAQFEQTYTQLIQAHYQTKHWYNNWNFAAVIRCVFTSASNLLRHRLGHSHD